MQKMNAEQLIKKQKQRDKRNAAQRKRRKEMTPEQLEKRRKYDRDRRAKKKAEKEDEATHERNATKLKSITPKEKEKMKAGHVPQMNLAAENNKDPELERQQQIYLSREKERLAAEKSYRLRVQQEKKKRKKKKGSRKKKKGSR